MKKILVVYYSQTGQLKRIIDSILSPLESQVEITYEELKPVPAFPFPWNGMPFFQAFPESVKEIPCEIEPLKCDIHADYDLVILAFTVWFLSPAIPVNSFLEHPVAKKLMQGKPVLTILGVRNMWVMAHERVKEKIARNGGRLVGNIVLEDPAPNLTSVITIVRWMMKGEKEAFRKFGKDFPPAGVPEQSIHDAKRFGELLSGPIQSASYDGLRGQLLAAGAVHVDPVLFNIEKRGKMIFGIWARAILKKGGYNDPAREGRLKIFQYYLFAVIYLVSPIVAGLFRLIFLLNPGAARAVIKKYS